MNLKETSQLPKPKIVSPHQQNRLYLSDPFTSGDLERRGERDRDLLRSFPLPDLQKSKISS